MFMVLLTKDKMVGGKQIRSRKNRLNRDLGKTIDVTVRNDQWQGSEFPIELSGELELRQGQGYFLKGTKAQLPLNHVRASSIGVYLLDLSRSLNQSPRPYMEALRV